jgi:hypothetical protein
MTGVIPETITAETPAVFVDCVEGDDGVELPQAAHSNAVIATPPMKAYAREARSDVTVSERRMVARLGAPFKARKCQ